MPAGENWRVHHEALMHRIRTAPPRMMLRLGEGRPAGPVTGRCTVLGVLRRFPFGDIVIVAGVEVPGLRLPELLWRIGPVRDSTPAERTPGPAPTYLTPPGKVDLLMDLKDDQKVDVSVTGKSEAGNPAPLPVGSTFSFTTDDPSVVTVDDHGDGTATYTATGVVDDETFVRVDVGLPDGRAVSGVAAIRVIAGDAETVEMVFAEPVEATPDA